MHAERWLARLLLPAVSCSIALLQCESSETPDSGLGGTESGLGGTESGGSDSGGTNSGGSDSAGEGSGGSIVIIEEDAGIPRTVCDVDPIETLPPCDDGVSESARCDGSVAGCVSTDSGDPVVYTCTGGREPYAWHLAVQTTSVCEDREPSSCTTNDEDEALRYLRQEIGAIASTCLGDESFLTVEFVDGCASLYLSSAHLPDQVECLLPRLEASRYPCAKDFCVGVHLSTLAPAPP